MGRLADVALRVSCGKAEMEFGILGPLEVRDGGALVRVPGAKERALLADLVVHAGRVVSADRLVEDLWGETPPGNPGNALQGRVSALRRALGSAGSKLVVTRPPGYVLEVDPEGVDAGRFEGLVAEATALASAEPPGAARLLEEALGLWRGAALAEFADRPWAPAEAARLEELRLAAVEALVELRLAAGGHAGLVGELEGLVAAQPTRERLRGQLMVALYRSGRQADALGVYQQTREVLAEELGIDPSPELQRLHQAILVQDPALELAAADGGQPRHNLPERLTSLVGRDEELGEVAKLVELHRLVTVVGPGGAGKTTVAVELARRLVGGYADGVWLVELAGLRDPALLAEIVAAALGLREEAGEPETPHRRPTGWPASSATSACCWSWTTASIWSGHAPSWSSGCCEAGPGLTVLATSREVLGVAGEVVWPVPPLAVPDADDELDAGSALPGPDGDGVAPEVLAGYDAVRLFSERAAAADPGFVLDRASGQVVAALCRRLDGLPLAIELAAARVRVLPVAELAGRLEDRFRLLAGGGRTVDARQQTLRATVDWSWELLDEPDRRLWRRLSVFVGGWTVEAAETVCSGDGLAPEDVLEGLFRLVDRSLVVAAGGVPARFAMLETLRDYGAERLAEAGETHALEARHTAWFLDLAERAAVHRTARRWLRLLDADYDNLRAVLDRAVAGRDLDTALRLAGALGWYWSTNRTIEGRQRLAAVAALADGRPPTHSLARVMQAAAMAEVQQTPTAGTVAAARRSQELFERFGDRRGAAFSKLLRGWATQQLRGPGGDLIRLAAEAEATFTELGDRWGEAFAAQSRFVFEINSQGLSKRTEAAARLALDRFQALDDQWGVAQAQFSLAQVARMRGDVGGAIAACERALAAARDGGPLWVMLASLSELGGLVGLQGDDARAAALQSEAAALFRRTGLRRGFAHLYNEVGAIARMRGDLERARQLHQEALTIVRELLGWSVPFTIAQLACAEARLGDLDDAEAHLREAAGLLLAAPDPETAPLVLVGAALVAAGRERPEQAARLLAAAEATRERTGVAATGAQAHEADLAGQAVRSALDPDALAAAEAGGRALATEAALRELVASA